jgi:hypothetical protein
MMPLGVPAALVVGWRGWYAKNKRGADLSIDTPRFRG